ncbi:hypothetical protein, partial [Morganella morganii]
LSALLSNNPSARHFAGQQRTYWLNKDNQPSVTVPVWPPRRSYTDTAELDETITAAIKSGTDITEQLQKAGYIKADYLFAGTSETEKKVWITRSGHLTYGTPEQFRLPVAVRDNPLTGERHLTRDKHHCVITKHT